MVAGGMKSVAPTAALLFFAIIFFGIMIDVGLFNPLVRLILRIAGGDPMRLVLGTAVLAMVVSLDGDGSTTFIIVTSALLPLYLKLKVSPVVLTVVAGLSNGARTSGSSDSKFARVRLVVVIGFFLPNKNGVRQRVMRSRGRRPMRCSRQPDPTRRRIHWPTSARRPH